MNSRLDDFINYSFNGPTVDPAPFFISYVVDQCSYFPDWARLAIFLAEAKRLQIGGFVAE